MTSVISNAANRTSEELLARNHIKFDPAMHDEGYIIVSSA